MLKSREISDGFILPQIGPYIVDAYLDVFGRAMPRCVARWVAGVMEQYEMDGSLIVAAIEYTAEAPRPAWAYARYMITLAINRGCKNGLDFRRQFSRGEDDDLPY